MTPRDTGHQYYRIMVLSATDGQGTGWKRCPLRDDRTVQGKPVARWGRKARDLPKPIRKDRSKTARLPVAIELDLPTEVEL